MPMFKTLPQMISGCNFGIVNVDINRNVIAMAKDTIDPIKFVPYIVFYANGRPIIKYSGPHDLNEIARFVTEVSKSLSVQPFSKRRDEDGDTGAVHQEERHIPEYTIGIPCSTSSHKNDETKLHQDNVCYLAESDAYKK
jgi:thioredoxin-like negative regulator of GroEL